MNCCECGEKLDVEKNDIPPSWYGRYIGNEMVKVICADCIKEPAKAKKWGSR